MHPLSNARQLAWRALLSALAGGGITAIALGGPVSAALGEEGTTSTTPSSEASPGASTASTQTTSAPQPPPSTTTTTSQAPESPTTTTTTAPAPPPPETKKTATPRQAGREAPTVVLQRKQRTTESNRKRRSASTTKPQSRKPPAPRKAQTNAKPGQATGANNVALPPQLVAGQAAALAAALASSSASVQALGFYRIPLFLLPIYKAAAVQYGVPWQILAAINEIETNFGADQSVSTAGAVGWMQFMPATWLQYGVDALDAGYADPYNPVDAIFAAARYLRAAGAASNLKAAIFAYNHSQEYVESVLLRARLISSYPRSVIATLTGLTDGRVPVTGKQVSWSAPAPASPSSATAGASATGGQGAAAGPSPGSAAAPAPSAAAATAPAAAAASRAPQFVELQSSPDALIVAVEDGRIVQVGQSSQLGRFIVERDVYGDLFTYAGLGSVAPNYVPRIPRTPAHSSAVEAASTRLPAPSQPATAGHQPPSTLSVRAPQPSAAPAAPPQSTQSVVGEEGPGSGKVRLFAHPGNPDARAAASARRLPGSAGKSSSGAGRLPLRAGSVVSTGTVLGRVLASEGAQKGQMRFAIRPAGDSSTIDPRPILANWSQLQSALHPQGAKSENPLLGATASDVLLLSQHELEHVVLSDPGVTLDACGRHEVASGRVDRRVLAVLAFLARSGLQPGAQVPGCASGALGGSAQSAVDIDIAAINGMPIAGHQGAGTITDLTIRTLLTLPQPFVPDAIWSLMRYPGSPNTHASRAYWDRIRMTFQAAVPASAPAPRIAATAARSPGTALQLGAPFAAPTFVSASQWDQLTSRIAALPVPRIAQKPTSAAIPDPKRY